MNTFNFNDDYELDFTLNTYCFLQQIYHYVNNDDMKSYVLYEYFGKWQKQIEESKLFNDEELKGILPIWFEYFIKILNCAKEEIDLQRFLQLVKSDIQNKSFDYIEKQWECLRAFNCEENEEEFIAEDSENDQITDEDSDIETGDDKIRAEFKHKCAFMVNLTVPNNFQFALFKMLFKTTKNLCEGPVQVCYPETMQFVNKVCCEKSSGKQKKPSICKDVKVFTLSPLATANDLQPEFYDDPVLFLMKLKIKRECMRKGGDVKEYNI